MQIAQIVLDTLGILFSFILSLIAIIISVKSIKLQNKSQNDNACIQLFDRRLQVYDFINDIWFIAGYLQSFINQNSTFMEIKKLIKNVNDEDIIKRLKNASDNLLKFSRMQGLLFDGDVKENIDKLFTQFDIICYGLLNDYEYYSFEQYQDNLNQFLQSYKNSAKWMDNLVEYIKLSDIKRI